MSEMRYGHPGLLALSIRRLAIRIAARALALLECLCRKTLVPQRQVMEAHASLESQMATGKPVQRLSEDGESVISGAACGNLELRPVTYEQPSRLELLRLAVTSQPARIIRGCHLSSRFHA